MSLWILLMSVLAMSQVTTAIGVEGEGLASCSVQPVDLSLKFRTVIGTSDMVVAHLTNTGSVQCVLEQVVVTPDDGQVSVIVPQVLLPGEVTQAQVTFSPIDPALTSYTIALKWAQPSPSAPPPLSGFAAVESSAVSEETTTVTNHNVLLPPGIMAGDLLVAGFVTFHDHIPTWPAGWTELASHAVSNLTSNNPRATLVYRLADGTEGTSLAVTTAAGTPSAHLSYRISGHGTQAPEVALNDHAGLPVTQPEPPALTPTGGAQNYLWLALAGMRVSPALTYPTNYLTGVSSGSLTPGGGSFMGAQRQLNSASEDPGFFTVEMGRYGVAFTVAIYPATP